MAGPYNFHEVLVYDSTPGGVMRLLRNGKVTVRDATGIAPADAGTGTVLETPTSTTAGTVTFTTTSAPTVDLVSPTGFVKRVTSPDSFAEASTAAASAASSAADAASAADSAAASAALVGAPAGTAVDAATVTYRAAGSGDERAALNTFLAGSTAGVKKVVGSLSVSDFLTVPSNTNLDLSAATITQTGTSKVTLDLNGVSNVTIRGGSIVGKGTDFAAGSTLALGISVRGGSSNVRISGVTVTNQAGAGIKVDASTDCTVSDCTVVGTSPPASTGSAGSQFGILVEGTSSRVDVKGNKVSATSQGIITSILSTNVNIHGNTVTGITGQHGMYIQTGARVSVVGNIVDSCNLCGIKLQINDTSTADVQRAVVANNIVSGVGSHGILISNVAAVRTYRFRDVAVVGNVVTGAGQDGVNLDSLSRATVADNVISSPGRHGVILVHCDDTTIESNRIQSAAQIGVLLNTATSTAINRVRVRGNTIVDPGTADVASNDYGIYILLGTDVTVEQNIVRDTGNRMRYGFFMGGGDQTTLVFNDNQITGATDYGARMVTGTAVKQMRGNLLTGNTLGQVLNAPSNWTAIASPASDTSGTKAAIDAIRAALTAAGITP